MIHVFCIRKFHGDTNLYIIEDDDHQSGDWSVDINQSIDSYINEPFHSSFQLSAVPQQADNLKLIASFETIEELQTSVLIKDI